jgi:hypothetical protein
MRTWDLWLAIIVYTITFFWFGLWVQKRVDQWQLKKWTTAAWSEGCNRCAQFEKDACARDQLQGVIEHKKITQ